MPRIDVQLSAAFRPTRKLLVGGDGIGIETFLRTPAESWLSAS